MEAAIKQEAATEICLCCDVCGNPAAYVCGDCHTGLYCGQDCQRRAFYELGHELICRSLELFVGARRQQQPWQLSDAEAHMAREKARANPERQRMQSIYLDFTNPSIRRIAEAMPPKLNYEGFYVFHGDREACRNATQKTAGGGTRRMHIRDDGIYWVACPGEGHNKYMKDFKATLIRNERVIVDAYLKSRLRRGESSRFFMPSVRKFPAPK